MCLSTGGLLDFSVLVVHLLSLDGSSALDGSSLDTHGTGAPVLGLGQWGCAPGQGSSTPDRLILLFPEVQ